MTNGVFWRVNSLATIDPIPAVPTNDVVVRKMIDHAHISPSFNVFRPAPFDDESGKRGEGIEGRAHTNNDEHERERLTRRCQRMNLAEPDSGHGRDGHVERVPDAPSLDEDVPGRAEGHDENQQREGGEESALHESARRYP